MQTGKYYLRKYRTHRSVLTAIVFKGTKYLSVVYYDDGVPTLFKKIKLSEAQYMDMLDESYTLAKACSHMLKSWRHDLINKQTREFIERAYKQEQPNDKVLTGEQACG